MRGSVHERFRERVFHDGRRMARWEVGRGFQRAQIRFSRSERNGAVSEIDADAPSLVAPGPDIVASLSVPRDERKQWRGRPAYDPRAKLLAPSTKSPCAGARFPQIVPLPNTHVPVVACRSAGIWTRGQSTALIRPAAGGEPANPAKRGTRLEATTDRAFLVSVGPPKVGDQRGLSILPGVRTGPFLVQTMALIAGPSASVSLGHGLAADRSAVRRWLLKPDPEKQSGRVGGSTTPHRVSNARGAKSHRRRILHFPRGGSARLGDAAHD